MVRFIMDVKLTTITSDVKSKMYGFMNQDKLKVKFQKPIRVQNLKLHFRNSKSDFQPTVWTYGN